MTYLISSHRPVDSYCPDCGSELDLVEYGSYSGRRSLTNTMKIIEDSFILGFDEVGQFILHCRTCEYSFVDFDIVDERIVFS